MAALRPDLAAACNTVFLADVLSGLSATPKTLPCQYFYDVAGSQLFEQITQLPEYYPTRMETEILTEQAGKLAQIVGHDALLVEYGAGASVKTRLLLDCLPTLQAYIPIDVAGDFLLQSAALLEGDYPKLAVLPVIGNFMDYTLPPSLPEGRRIGFFPGSTIGNLNDTQITSLLTNARSQLGSDAIFIIGVDLYKSEDILIPAYQDSAGLTAQFNLNMLKRINRELGADFDLSGFVHEARWNPQACQVEMHLVSTQDQTVRLAGQTFDFVPGESIHTENSRKFKIKTLTDLMQASGWHVRDIWKDAQSYFSVMVLICNEK